MLLVGDLLVVGHLGDSRVVLVQETEPGSGTFVGAPFLEWLVPVRGAADLRSQAGLGGGARAHRAARRRCVGVLGVVKRSSII